MALLKSTFVAGIDLLFSTFEEAVKSSDYIVTNDDGFDVTEVTTLSDIPVLLDEFSQDDVEKSSMYKLIQPTDTKGMIPGKYFTVDLEAGNKLDVEGRIFSIVGFETDPYKALYTLALRDL